MFINKVQFKILSIIIIALILAACGTVPKEVVELSYIIGKDLHSLYESYDSLIHQYFENLRSQRLAYLDDIWYPRFLENWRDDGELVGIAKGERIWSESDSTLISISAESDPKESLKTLNDWVLYALYAYEIKENDLIESLNEKESALRSDVKQAFDQIIIANAVITAHLNSLRKVQEVNNEALNALGIKDLRDKINDTLIEVSIEAESELKKIKTYDAKITNLVDALESISN